MISKKRKRIVGMISWNRKNHGSKEGAPVSDDKILASALFNKKSRFEESPLALSHGLHHSTSMPVHNWCKCTQVSCMCVIWQCPSVIHLQLVLGTSMTGPSVTVNVYPRGQDQVTSEPAPHSPQTIRPQNFNTTCPKVSCFLEKQWKIEGFLVQLGEYSKTFVNHHDYN